MNRRPVAFAVIFALLGTGCGRQPSGTSPLFPAPQGTTWGFIDNRGKIVIAPRFEAALPYSEGLAAVKREGRWGYIDLIGSEVIPIRYRTVQSFRNGFAIVDAGLPDHPVGLIDTSGSWVTPPLFRSLSAADGPDGLLLGQKEPAEGFGFYDRSGNLVLGPYFLAFPFAQGRARVKTGVRASSDDWLIEASGTFLPRKPLVLDGMRFSEGLIAIRQDRKLGYMDLAGNIAIEPRYDQGGEFAEGLAAVQLEGHWMFIDKSGALTAEFPGGVAFAEPLSDGLSLVSADRDQPGGKFGYVDRKGQWTIKPSWDDAQPFHEGLAYVGTWKAGKTAYIDHKGRIIWEGQDGRSVSRHRCGNRRGDGKAPNDFPISMRCRSSAARSACVLQEILKGDASVEREASRAIYDCSQLLPKDYSSQLCRDLRALVWNARTWQAPDGLLESSVQQIGPFIKSMPKRG